jgi:hypothetical protein
MAHVFERIQTAETAGLCYLIGDDDAGIAAVFDPRAATASSCAQRLDSAAAG